MNMALMDMVDHLHCSFDSPIETMIRPAAVEVVETCLIERETLIRIFRVRLENISRGKYLIRWKGEISVVIWRLTTTGSIMQLYQAVVIKLL